MRETTNQHGKRARRLDTIYIGYDPRDHNASEVLINSILKHASRPLNIVTLNQASLRRSGLYFRAPHMDSTVWAQNPLDYMVDGFDGKPLSTEFSFSRFLVPFLNQHEGFALFMDNDMYFRSDPCEIFDRYATEDAPAIQCVKHEFEDGGKVAVKLYGCPQTFYRRKNWSSVMLWNCAHPAHQNLTVHDVSTKSGTWLHNLQWLEDQDIGAIGEEWNWLPDHSSEELEAKNVHFTNGGPWFKVWEPKREADIKYGLEWEALRAELDQS
jgi:hypothetical protein